MYFTHHTVYRSDVRQIMMCQSVRRDAWLLALFMPVYESVFFVWFVHSLVVLWSDKDVSDCHIFFVCLSTAKIVRQTMMCRLFNSLFVCLSIILYFSLSKSNCLPANCYKIVRQSMICRLVRRLAHNPFFLSVCQSVHPSDCLNV